MSDADRFRELAAMVPLMPEHRMTASEALLMQQEADRRAIIKRLVRSTEPLAPSFLLEWHSKARGCEFLGVPVMEMTIAELQALAAFSVSSMFDRIGSVPVSASRRTDPSR